jgi:membrane-bound metal-dependent hydrolase YbcI (DUF457 family)
MFVGHGLVAFALVAGLASLAGWEAERALAVGALAGAFGLAPDVDILYAPVGLLGASGLLEAETAFWTAGNVVHRTVTHSVLVGAVAAVAAGLWAARARGSRLLAAGLGTGLIAVAALDGALPAAIMAAFAATAFALATVGGRYGVDARPASGAAFVGFVSHPFGDLFTGAPPDLLYPLDVTLVAERVVLHPDPTMHLLAAFALELLTIWAAALVYLHVTDRRVADHVSPHAMGGLAFAGAVVFLPPPSLETPYRFVAAALGVGTISGIGVGVDPRRWRGRVVDDADRPRLPTLDAAMTALVAVSTALVAYAAVYLVA